jgi:hypothetical protein
MSQTIPPQPVGRRELVAPHRLLRALISVIVILSASGIVVWEILRVTTPPQLVVTSPTDNLLTASHRVVLEGSVHPGSSLTANGSPVGVTVDGKFKENMDLRTGANIITIIATKKFAKPNIIYRRVVVTN